MSDREVKTRQTFSEACEERQWVTEEYNSYRVQGWNAALASVILPEGRFEVGQKVEWNDGGEWVPATIYACITRPGQDIAIAASGFRENVRPLPTTKELS